MPMSQTASTMEVQGGDTVRNDKVSKLSELELMSALAGLFMKGLTVKEMQTEMVERYGKAGEMNREQPYRILREAGRRGFFRFTPPPDHAIERRISDHFLWLKRVNVVRTVVPLDVARETAEMLLRLVQDFYKNDPDKNEIHIGFAAGLSMREVAKSFAHMLTYPVPGLPETLVFHAMLSGHDPGDPTTDPNNFFTFFIHPPTLQFRTEFVGFRAPAIVETESIPEFMRIKEISDARLAANDLDIIVTSGADWEDEDSSLLRCMQRSSSTVETLRGEGTVGDMLWLPLGETAPITTPTSVRALTIMELTDLPEFIRRGKHVLLMLGPCSQCDRHKGRILRTIFAQNEHIVTHVVVDSRTGGYLANSIDQGLI